MKTITCSFLAIYLIFISASFARAEEASKPTYEQTLFDDKLMLHGYAEKYKNEPKEILLAMIQDENLAPLKMAAAIEVFKNKFSRDLFAREKITAERILLRALDRTESPFVEVEIMHTLCRMDRYKYFDSLVPELILKLDHYNTYIDEMAFNSLNDIIDTGSNRAHEARIVFNTLRRILFLSRKRLASVTQPTPQLTQKLQILRWSIKVLGNQELKKLPPEVIRLL